MDFHLAFSLLVSAYCLRLLEVNRRLRREADPWRALERRRYPRVP